jgi:hypothetical protein
VERHGGARVLGSISREVRREKRLPRSAR